jgi:RimJ/RimL family protein N-acetyltransferase
MFEVAGLRVAPVDEQDGSELDALLVRCADFIRMSEGLDPVPGDGRLLIEERPQDAPEVQKLVLGLFDGPCLIGVLDLLKDYPADGTWYLGLMLIEPARRREGLGTAVFEALQGWVADQGGRAIRLAVIAENAAGERFWDRLGFRQIGTVDQDLGHFRRTLRRMERPLG